jgi:5-methylcytosine-specific restriction enzyme A
VRRGRCARHQLRGRTISEGPWRRLVKQVVARDHGVCWICGKRGATSADHVLRVRDGGTDALENLRAVHVVCNQRRG